VGRRDDLIDHDFVAASGGDEEDVDIDIVVGGNARFAERVAGVLIAIGEEHDAFLVIRGECGHGQAESAGDIGATGVEDFNGLRHLAFFGGERTEDGIAAKFDDDEEIVLIHFFDFEGNAITDVFAGGAGNGLGLVNDEDDTDALTEPDEASADERENQCSEEDHAEDEGDSAAEWGGGDAGMFPEPPDREKEDEQQQKYEPNRRGEIEGPELCGHEEPAQPSAHAKNPKR